MAFQSCTVAALASLALCTPLFCHPCPTVPRLLLFSAVPLIWRWCKVKDRWRSSDMPIRPPLCLVSNPLPSRCMCLASGSKFHLPPTLHPSAPLPPSAPVLLGCWSWCGLATRAKWDTMHNYVVKGHHDGNISVPRHHDGILSLPTASLLSAASIRWRLTPSTQGSWRDPLGACFHQREQSPQKKPVREILTRRAFPHTTLKVFLVMRS